MINEPIPFEEAAKILQDKPAVTRAVFDRLLPELQARAFVITGVDAADALQAARDAIAEIPRGADWRTTKKALIAQLDPWLGDAAPYRVELLMRWHGYQAYGAANAEHLDANKDLFPFRQYITANDARVRETHAALEGLVLPADSPFWDRHTPPWEYNCRCDVRGITAEEAEEMIAEDTDKDPGGRRVIDGAVKDALENQGRLVREVNEIYDVRTPRERGESGPDWSAKELRIPLDALRARYASDPQTWAAFEAWAKQTKVDEIGTIWEWISGQAVAAVAKVATKALAVTAVDARTALAALSVDISDVEIEINSLLGGKSRYNYDNSPSLRDSIPGLPEAYAKRDAVIGRAREAIAVDPTAVRPFKPSTKARKDRKILVERHGEALDLWAKMVGSQNLAAMNSRKPLRMVRRPGRAYYDLKGSVHLSPYDSVSTHMHEIAHWMEDCSPELLARSVQFLERRTINDRITYYHGRLSEPVKADLFWSDYCGKQYKSRGNFYATEIVSMGIERFTFDPIKFAIEDPDYFDFIFDTLRKPL